MFARGYTLAEVSGRSLRTQTLEDGRMVVEPMPNAGDRTKTNRVVREFCNGEVDVLLLTSSGSTGLSAQASPALGSDVRVRRMIKWEMQANITDERQIDGRPNRTGQIVLPEYAIPLSGLVADDRLAMQFNNKNRSLTSSTVANRDSKDLIRDVPDLLNVVGDIVAMQMLVERPDLAMKLDISLPQDEMVSEASHRSLEYIGRLTGRIALLKVAEQEALYAELQSRFVEVLDRLKAEGRNPLEVECHEWNATVVSRRVFMGKERAAGAPEKSALNSPIFLTELQYKRTLKAVRSSDVAKWILSRSRPLEAGQLGAEAIALHLAKNRTEILQQYLGKKHATIEIALQAKEPNETKNSAAKLDWLVANLPLLKPGAIYFDVDIEGKKLPKVVGNVILPGSVAECMRLSDYVVTVMEPGSDGIQAKSLSSLFAADLVFENQDFQSAADVRATFDDAKDGVVVRTVRVFDGNLFEATSMNLREKLGTKIVYTDATGARQHGILVHAGIPDIRLEAVPERVRVIDELVGVVRRGGTISTVGVSTAKSNDKGLQVQRDGSHFRLAAPASKFGGGGIYLDPVLALISGKEKTNRFGLQFKSSRGVMVATVEEANLPKVLAYLSETKGEKFYVRDKRLLQSVRDTLASDKDVSPEMK